MQQLEFQIIWNISPLFGKFRVADDFLLETLEDPDDFEKINLITHAYVGVERDRKSRQSSIPMIELFTLTLGLTSNIYATYRFYGVGLPLANLNRLGQQRVLYKHYQTAEVHLSPEEVLLRPITDARVRFLELRGDQDAILQSYLGLALRYFSYALNSQQQRRFDEQVLFLSIAAEALFSTGRAFRRNLKNRLSTFIAKSEEEKQNITHCIEAFYDYRGAIVHGGMNKTKLNDNEVTVVRDYIRRAIDQALTLKFYDKTDLIQYIE
jgi:hypothetical protein